MIFATTKKETWKKIIMYNKLRKKKKNILDTEISRNLDLFERYLVNLPALKNKALL